MIVRVERNKLKKRKKKEKGNEFKIICSSHSTQEQRCVKMAHGNTAKSLIIV